MRVLSYNIRHGQGVGGFPSNARIARLIAATGCDVAALTEVWRRPGGYDQPALLSGLTGLAPSYYALWRSMGFDEGDLALTALRVESVTTIDLGGSRGCVVIVCGEGAGRFAFAATHLSVATKPRLAQIEMLAERLPRDIPLVLAGDFNCGVSQLAPLRGLLDFPRASPRTFPSAVPLLALDHIGFSRHWRLDSLATIRSWASDHLPLLADLTLVG